MIKNPVATAWLRLGYVLIIFFLLNAAMGSQPIRSRTVEVGQVLIQSAEMAFLLADHAFF